MAERQALFYPSAPTTYTLELTSHCNNNCIGCGNVFPRSMDFLPGEEWRKLLALLKPHIFSLRITGGEPTLHPDFEEIIRYVDGFDVPLVVFSNGRWQNPQVLIELFKNRVNLDGLLISLHGKDAPSHEAFTQTESFAETVENIRLAAQAGLRVGTNAVPTKANHQDIEEIVALALGLGASSVAFSRYYGKLTPLTDLTHDELKAAIEKVSTLKRKDKRVIFNNCVPPCFSGMSTKRCPSGVTHCTIDPLGNVRPCTHAPLILGNLFEQSIEEIWDSEAVWEWRNMIPKQCYECAQFANCGGGCRATAMQRGLEKDPLIKEPLRREQPKPVKRLKLYQWAKPVARFRVKEEKFGYLLVNRSAAVPVSSRARPLLNALDGAATLQDIKERFGQEALNFVGLLYKKGLLKITRPAYQ